MTHLKAYLKESFGFWGKGRALINSHLSEVLLFFLQESGQQQLYYTPTGSSYTGKSVVANRRRLRTHQSSYFFGVSHVGLS